MNRRGAERPKLVCRCEARDAGSGRLVGRVVDLTTRGLRLACDEPAELFRDCPLVLHLEQADGGGQDLHLEGRCVWVQRDVDPVRHSAGFEFRQLSPPQEALLEEFSGRCRFSQQVS